MSAGLAVPEGLQGEAAVATELQNLLVDGYSGMAPVYEAAFAIAALSSHAWRPASCPPQALPHGSHYPVTVLVVIDDPRYRVNGDEPFVDVASWWPAAKKWTVTHQARSDAEAADHECRVIAWRPMLDLPPAWSELWRCVP